MTPASTSSDRIAAIRAAQNAYFRTGATLPAGFRRTMLRRLEQALVQWEGALCEALWLDLHKSPEEAYLTELSIVRGEVRHHLRHLGRWMRPEHRPTPLKLQPSSSRILSEPLGTALIVAPWNYPVQLLLNPWWGHFGRMHRRAQTLALYPARGRHPCTDDRPDLRRRVCRRRTGPPRCQYTPAPRTLGPDLLHRKPRTGPHRHGGGRTPPDPVVLELGGKSPCIVDRGADIGIAARRIAWGKTLNAGQTCIAPDYLLLHRSLLEEFPAAYARAIRQLHGDDPQRSRHYVRLVNDRAFDRVAGYLRQGKILTGGRTDRSERYIEPTLLAEVDPDAPVMREEIFGPVLPVIPFDTAQQAVDFVTSREKPLALYYFGPERTGRDVLLHTSSGGACLNDTIMHIANEQIPFGGVGNSGMGRYHGRDSFDAFSHRRATVTTPTWIDPPFRYMPYRFFRWVKRIL